MKAPIEARQGPNEPESIQSNSHREPFALGGWLQLFLGGSSTELFLARMKRFSDTARFDEGWYVELPPEMKAAWELLWAKCDCAGVWEPSFKLAEFQIGKKVAWGELAERLRGRIVILPSGAWWLRDFVRTQCGELSSECRAHIPVINRLREHRLITSDSLSIDYSMTIHSHKEQEQEKETDKEKEKGGGVQRGRARGTAEELKAFCVEVGLPASDGEWCFDKWEGAGWKNGKLPIICWRSTIRAWARAGYMASQKNGKGKPSEKIRTYEHKTFEECP